MSEASRRERRCERGHASAAPRSGRRLPGSRLQPHPGKGRMNGTARWFDRLEIHRGHVTALTACWTWPAATGAGRRRVDQSLGVWEPPGVAGLRHSRCQGCGAALHAPCWCPTRLADATESPVRWAARGAASNERGTRAGLCESISIGLWIPGRRSKRAPKSSHRWIERV